jgi:hypothetical protein
VGSDLLRLGQLGSYSLSIVTAILSFALCRNLCFRSVVMLSGCLVLAFGFFLSRVDLLSAALHVGHALVHESC